MNTALLIVAVISTVCTCAATCFHLWLDWKKSKEPPKDEIWETAVRLYCANGGEQPEMDEFARVYLMLKALKKRDNPLAPFESFEATLLEDTHKAAD